MTEFSDSSTHINYFSNKKKRNPSGSHECLFRFKVAKKAQTTTRGINLPLKRPQTPMKVLPDMCVRVTKCLRILFIVSGS